MTSHRIGDQAVFIACLTLILLTIVSLGTPGAALSDSGHNGERRALLFGINKYQAVPRLNGSLNDVAVMRQSLIQQWGFKEEHVVTVLDEHATRAGIFNALEQLVRETGPNDAVYIHYSGHGSQVPDLNGDEEDGLDETLVPQDGRTGRVPDITDDELEVVFARLRARHVLIVLDSCHSGTATRSVDIRVRSVPQDTRMHLYRPAVTSRQVVPLQAQRHILMTGAAAHEQALDGPVEGRYHGFFSYALSKSLRSASPSVTPREVFSGVEQELKRIQAHFGRPSMPEPQLEAPPQLLESPLFGNPASTATDSSPASRTAWIEVRPGNDRQILLLNGPLFGATPGSVWAIYPPGETTFAPTGMVATATVTEKTGKDALARLSEEAPPVLNGSRAIAVLTGRDARVPIRWLGTPQPIRARLTRELELKAGTVDFVGEHEFARFLLESTDHTLRVYSADGSAVVASLSLKDARWSDELARIISRSAATSELMSLDNPNSRIRVTVKVARPTPARLARGIAVVADTHPALYRIRKPGETRLPENSLQLEIESDTEGYLTIVDVDSEGRVNTLFPTDHQQSDFYPEGKISAGQPVLIPDSLTPGNRAGFFWDYTPPAGEDTIRVFLTANLETAELIRSQLSRSGQPAAGATGVSQPGMGPSPLESVRSGLTAVASRGFIVVNERPTGTVAPVLSTPPNLSAASAGPATQVPESPSTPLSPSSTTAATNTATPATESSHVRPAPASGDWTAATVSILVQP